MSEELTEAEAKVYDRQLRVWGVEVQKRLNAARVLIAGCTSGVAAEAAKNIALAGVGSLFLLDPTPCTSEAAVYNFLVPADADADQSVAEASAATLREMNPLVKIAALPGPLPPEPEEAFLKGFDVILITGAPLSTLLAYDSACRDLGVAFYMASSRGSASFFFADLRSHTYTLLDAPSGGGPAQKATVAFPSLASALAHPWKRLRQRWTHKLVYVLRVCADFERQKGRFPGENDVAFLAQQARVLAAEARADAAVDAKSGAAPSTAPRDLVTEDVMPEEALREFVLGVKELPPVSAVLGGVLANEMLKAVSRKGEPICNFFFFSLADNVGMVEKLGQV